MQMSVKSFLIEKKLTHMKGQFKTQMNEKVKIKIN
jgi:hypothetical protein